MDKVTFLVRVTQDDWVEERGGWRCEAARVGSVESLLVGSASYKPQTRGDIVIRPKANLDPSVPMFVEVAIIPKSTKGWQAATALVALLVPIVGLVVTGYYNGRAEDTKARAAVDVANIQAEVTKLQDQARQEREANQTELARVVSDKGKAVGAAKVECEKDFKKILENCAAEGKSVADCRGSTFNIKL